MSRFLLGAAIALALTLPLAGAPRQASPASQASASTPVLDAAEAGKLMPATVFFKGQSASLQERNSAGIRFSKDSLLLVALVDTSGYSSSVQQKYQAYLLTQEPIEIGGHRLAPGAYGCGFIAGNKFVVMDIGAHDLVTVSSAHDTEIRRPTPLQILPSGNHYRFYEGRNYVDLIAPAR